MRDPWDWTEQELLQLITDQVAESLSLDYKECAALQRTDGKKSEISKDVSAFANSAGGVLVYGMKENGHVPVELDIGFDPGEISKEWVEQVINSRIARRVDGLRVRQVPLSGSRAGRVAYVVFVPASARAPHMASDHRYYKRFNFESVPMEDYEVRDVSRRFVAPDVRLGLVLRNPEGRTEITIVPTFDLYVENLSAAPADFALITFHISAGNHPNVSGVGKAGDSVVVLAGTPLAVNSYKIEWRGSLRLPLMQGAKYHLADLSLSLADAVGAGQILWEVFTPGADTKRGTVTLRREDGVLTMDESESEWHLADQPVWHI